MTSNAPQVLGVMLRHLTGVHVKTQQINRNFRLMAGLAAGAASALAGAAMLRGLNAIVREGDKIVEQQMKLRAIGVSASHVATATQAAEAISQQVLGTNPAENLRVIRELRGVLNDTQEAISAAPAFLRAQIVLGQYGGARDQSMLALVKAMDIKGAFVKNGQLDVGALEHALLSGQTALALTSGLLTPDMFYRFTRMAGPAAAAMNTESYLKDFTEVMMGLGSTGGRGLQMAAKTFLGGQVTKANVEQLVSLGLIRPQDVLKDHGHYALKSGSLKGYQELLDRGFAQWFHDVVVPAMKDHHFTGPAAVLQALSSLPVTEQRLFSFLYTNWAQVEKFAQQFDQASGTNAYQTAQKMSPAANLKNLEEAWESLWQTIGHGAAPAEIAVLRGLTSVLRELQQIAANHPEMTTGLLGLSYALAALAAVGGSIAVVTFGLRGLLAPIRGLAAATGLFAAGSSSATGLLGLVALLGRLAAAGSALSFLYEMLHPTSTQSPEADRAPYGGKSLHERFPGLIAKPGSPESTSGAHPGVFRPNPNLHDNPGATHQQPAAPPGLPPTHAPIPVVVVNPHDVGHAVSGGLTRGATRPPAGPTAPDYRLNYPMPATAQ